MTIGAAQTVDAIAQTIWDQYEASPPSKRILVSISGIPGAGKSTLARQLCHILNQIFVERHHDRHGQASRPDVKLPESSPDIFAIDVPMDGFHLSRAQLLAMPDPETAMHRRGAAFTYDAAGYCRLVEQLRRPIDSTTVVVSAPSFDHARKDPVADSIRVGRKTHVVLLEGNYVNLDREPWSSAAKLFDLRLTVTIGRDIARERLVKRHVVSGICADKASARYRVETTDDLNAEDILENQVPGVVSVMASSSY